jgi:filamentous hemagglutinin family protein
MKKNSGYVMWRSLLFNSLVVSGVLSFQCDRTFSQVTPDDTLGDESSVVNTRDETSDSINGGAIRGQNLFHSFEEFNVGEDRGVYFSNPNDVTNIFSRVTGNNVSNILGTLGVDGVANLFLINPNGIVFGEGASLDVQGSFAATTADGIEFGEQGFFGVSNPESPKLLTINPSAYLFNQVAPGAIANSSKASADSNPETSFDDDFFGLRVPDGQSLLLLGGNVETNGGGLVASGGRIDIGAVTGQGVIGLNNNGSLNIPNSIARGDVSLTNGARFLVAGDGGGDLAISAKDIRIDSASGIYAGILSNLGSSDAQAGDININATGAVNLSEESGVENSVEEGATGNSGNINVIANDFALTNSAYVDNSTSGTGNAGEITINANSLQVLNGGQIGLSTFGQGNAGSINIFAKEFVSLNDGNGNTFIFNNVGSDGRGSSGGINITTGSLFVDNGAQIQSLTEGIGDSGKIVINASDIVSFNGRDAKDFASSAVSNVEEDAKGDAGGIEISASSLLLTNRAQFSSSTQGIGDAGNISIQVEKEVKLGNSSILSEVTAPNENGISGNGGRGEGGNITIQANSLLLEDGSSILADTENIGNAGDIILEVNESIILEGEGLGPFPGDTNIFPSQITATVDSFDGSRGEGGSINISTPFLSVADGGFIRTSTLGLGNAGNVKINANNIKIDGGENGLITGFLAQVGEGATGKGGDINIGSEQSSVEQLNLINGAGVSVSTFGQGEAGNLSIFANNIKLDGGANSLLTGLFAGVREEATGKGGNINIGSEQSSVEQLSITNGAEISVSSLGEGKAGELGISANFLNLNNDAVISSQSESTFDAGNITLDIADSVQATDSSISTSSSQSSGGNLTIAGGNIRLRGNTKITTNIFSGEGSGGNIDVTADSVIAFDDSDIFASAPEGKGGNITLNTPAYFGENFTLNSLTANPNSLDNNSRADVNATGASPGVVSVPDVSSIQNSLTELANDSLNTDELVANSCVVPVGDRGEGKFIITGTESLPVRPGDGIPSKFPTGEVRSVPEKQSSWQPGDPIVEPQGAYRLADGKLVLSRKCSR